MPTLQPRRTQRTRAIAMEFLAFQEEDKIGAKMEEQIGKICEKIKKGEYKQDEQIPDSPEGKELVKLIKDRYGIKVDFICDEHLAAIIPFYSNRNHIFLDKFFRGNLSLRDQQKLLNRDTSQKGTVNADKVYVSGIFSDYEHVTYMNFRELQQLGLTAPEITAVLLHELGHAFNACEYADRTETNNQILADVFREITGRNDKRDMVYIYRELKKVNKEITEAEVDTIVNGNKVIAGYTWFKMLIGSVKEQLSNPAYSRTAFEAGSDMFTNRFGYGRQLVSALAKLHNSSWFTSGTHAQRWAYFAFTTIEFVFTATLIFSGLFLMTPSFGVIAMALSFAIQLRMSGDDQRDMTYDELRVRYARVRHDMVEFLKRSKKLKPAKMREAVDGIKELDTIIEGVGTYKNFYVMVANVIFGGARDANNSVKEQQLLEQLTTNDLFVRSAELQLAASET